jgi:hypothetical protein
MDWIRAQGLVVMSCCSRRSCDRSVPFKFTQKLHFLMRLDDSPVGVPSEAMFQGGGYSRCRTDRLAARVLESSTTLGKFEWSGSAGKGRAWSEGCLALWREGGELSKSDSVVLHRVCLLIVGTSTAPILWVRCKHIYQIYARRNSDLPHIFMAIYLTA